MLSVQETRSVLWLGVCALCIVFNQEPACSHWCMVCFAMQSGQCALCWNPCMVALAAEYLCLVHCRFTWQDNAVALAVQADKLYKEA